MNREILFKAKRIYNGEWVKGYIVNNPKEGWTIYSRCDNPPDCDPMWNKVLISHKVDENTICQYTGLTDKNGNKIWENDIVAYLDTYSTDNGYAEADCIGQVVWDNETLSFQVTERLSAESYEVLDECAVIGNIFDNPELLEGGAEE